MVTYYDTQLDCPSNSMLKHFRVSPYSYWHHVTHGEHKDTASMSLGRIIHLAILEPEDFRRTVILLPQMDLRSRAAKGEYVSRALGTAEVVADIDPSLGAPELREAVAGAIAAAGKTLVTSDQMETLKDQIASLNLPQHAMARQVITMHELVEHEIRWVDPVSGAACKAKIDLASRVHSTAADLKSCQSATADAFRRSLWQYGYHYQEAMYRRALRATGLDIGDGDFAFVVCETASPWHWNVLRIHPDDIWEADQQISRELLRLRECLESGRWPGLIGEEPEVVSMKKRLTDE